MVKSIDKLFAVHLPEDHAAMMGAARTANRYLPLAHAQGYSQDICSYLTSDIGAYIAGESPLKAYGLERAPKPDVLVFNTNQCRDVRDWFEWYGRELHVPVIGVHSPRSVDAVTEGDVEAVSRQIESLVAPLEQVAGTRLDDARLKAAIRASRDTARLWGACLETASARPAPFTFFDASVHMGPAPAASSTRSRCALASMRDPPAQKIEPNSPDDCLTPRRLRYCYYWYYWLNDLM